MADTQQLHDDLGASVTLPVPVRRVVSLVPSLTETVAATAPELLVGATAWCSHPADLDVPRVRGTKNPDLDHIRRLRPDVVLANQEENRERDVQTLRAAGIPVWVTAIRNVDEAFASLERLVAHVCGSASPPWLAAARAAWQAPPPATRRFVVVPIWRRPWMVVGRDTFTGDVLRRLGLDNRFRGHPDRYPRVGEDDIRATRPDLIVFPDEPYAFHAGDGPECFPGIPFALVSGRHLTWYGPSLAEAHAVLSDRLAGAARS